MDLDAMKTTLGQLTTGWSTTYWNCVSGCGSSSVNVINMNYICTGASPAHLEDFEQGERTFTYDFRGPGPFTIS